MKRKVLLVAAVVTASFAFAQDGATVSKSFTSKNGHEVLPQADEHALGLSLDPVLSVLAPIGGGAVNFPGATNVTIWGKCFKDAETAMRGRLNLGFGSNTTKSVNATDATKTDESTTSVYNVTLGAGLEKRRGASRVQGIYGAEALLSFNNGAGTTTNTDGNTGFEVETKTGSTFMLGARGFVGVEYFVAPKISLAAEYGWGLSFSTTGDTEVSSTAPGATTTTTPGGSSFNLGTDLNNNAQASILFHF